MFDELIVWYLFLGGSGASLAALLSAADLLRCRTTRHPWTTGLNRTLFARGYVLATIALVVGAICLLADLGRPERFYYVFLRPTTSILTFGSFVLGITIACAATLGAIALGNLSRTPRTLIRIAETTCTIGGVATAAYTGALLCSLEVAPLWNSALPFLFAFSSLSVGCAGILTCAAPVTGPTRAVAHAITRIDLACIALEALALAACLALAAFDQPSWSQGENGHWVSWATFVGCALVIPAFLEAMSLRSGSTRHLAWVLPFVAVGGFFLRACVVGTPII